MSFAELFELGAIVWEGDLPTLPDYIPTDEDVTD